MVCVLVAAIATALWAIPQLWSGEGPGWVLVAAAPMFAFFLTTGLLTGRWYERDKR